jgi:fructose-1,6-bisphosphatase/inositol monophosphatase family enzyme
VARACAREAGRVLRAVYGRPLTETVKGRGNIVTEADFASERLIASLLAAEFPGHGLLAEETRADTPLSGFVWVIDPLDGTRNFASGLPLFCVNVALCLDGEPLLGLTYDPLRREELLAVRGRGLRLDGRAVRASTKPSVRDSVLGMDMGFDDRRGRLMLESIIALWPGMQAVRIIGSAALGIAYAACGRLDLFVHHSLKPWDLAAGILLVREGGGVITDRDGGPATLRSEGVVCGGPVVHADFLRLAAGLAWRE